MEQEKTERNLIQLGYEKKEIYKYIETWQNANKYIGFDTRNQTIMVYEKNFFDNEIQYYPIDEELLKAIVERFNYLFSNLNKEEWFCPYCGDKLDTAKEGFYCETCKLYFKNKGKINVS